MTYPLSCTEKYEVLYQNVDNISVLNVAVSIYPDGDKFDRYITVRYSLQLCPPITETNNLGWLAPVSNETSRIMRLATSHTDFLAIVWGSHRHTENRLLFVGFYLIYYLNITVILQKLFRNIITCKRELEM